MSSYTNASIEEIILIHVTGGSTSIDIVYNGYISERPHYDEIRLEFKRLESTGILESFIDDWDGKQYYRQVIR